MSMQTDQPRFPQLSKEPLLKSRSRPQFQNRVWAKTLDFLIVQASVALLYWIYPFLGVVVAFLVWGFIDSLGRGQSPGKWLLGLHTIDLKRATKPGFYQGLMRNIPFLLLTLSLVNSFPVSNFVTGLMFIWIAAEAYFSRSIKSGLRVGDVLGGTRVFEYKDEHTKFIEQYLLKEEELM